MRSLFELTGDSSLANIRRLAELGFICDVISMSKAHQTFFLNHIRCVVKPALAHKQARVYFNKRGDPVAYVMWARIAPDVEKRFQESGVWDLHISEWNEGGQLWIVDMAAQVGHVRTLLRKLRDELFVNEQTIRYFRIKNNHLLCKEVQRKPGAHS